MNTRVSRPLALAGAALLLALVPIPFLGDLRPRIPTLLVLWLVAHGAYLGAARHVLRHPRAMGAAATGTATVPGAAAARSGRPGAFAWILGCSLRCGE